MLLLLALNAMFDITTTRAEAARVHPPLMIFGMLGALTLACLLFAGYDMAIRRRRNVLHSVAFAVVLSVTAYVIIDLEYPRPNKAKHGSPRTSGACRCPMIFCGVNWG